MNNLEFTKKMQQRFCESSGLNLEEDTPELSGLVREGVRSRHTTHRKGDIRKLLVRFRAKSRK